MFPYKKVDLFVINNHYSINRRPLLSWPQHFTKRGSLFLPPVIKLIDGPAQVFRPVRCQTAPSSEPLSRSAKIKSAKPARCASDEK